jgi:PAS domain S-box-containing protein
MSAANRNDSLIKDSTNSASKKASDEIRKTLTEVASLLAECCCLVEAPSDGVLEFDIFLSSSGFLGHEQPGKQQMGFWLFEKVPPGDQAVLQKILRKVLYGKTFVTELRIYDSENTERLCQVTAKPVWDEEEKTVSAGILFLSALSKSKGNIGSLISSAEKPTLINSILKSFVIVDNNGEILSFAPSVRQLLKVPVDENLLGRNIRSFFCRTCRNFPFIENQEFREYEMSLADKKNGDKWLLVSSFPILKTEFSRGSNYLLLRDITSSKLSQLALSESEEKFRTLADNTPAAIFLEVNREIIYANHQVENILGYKVEDLKNGKVGLKDILDIEIARQMKNEIVYKLKSDKIPRAIRTMNFNRADGSKGSCILSVQCMPYNGQRGYLGTITDITSVDETNKRLEETKQRYRALFESASDAIFVENLEGIVLDCNKSAQKRYGYSKNELIGMHAKQLVPGDYSISLDAVKEEVKQIKKLNKTLNIIATGKRKDGSIFPTEVSIDPLKLGNDDLYLVTVRDISMRKELEASRKKFDSQMHQIKLLDSYSTVVKGLANDFNNILTGIMGYADLILRDISPNSVSRNKVTKILEAARKGGDLIQKLISSTGKLPANFQTIEIGPFLREFIPELENFIDGKGELNYKIEDSLPSIVCDIGQIKEALLNLVSNGINASNQNGVFNLEVCTGTKSFDGSEPGYLGPPMKKGNYIQLSLEDNGKGIETENLNKIFEPFYSTSNVNRGLGLSIVLGTLRSHRGGIYVQSETNKGAKFSLLIPVRNSDKTNNFEPEAKEIKKANPMPAGLVLIIDDDESVSEILATQLQTIGYETCFARNGNEGIEKFKMHDRNLSLVIIDLAMPEKSGYEVLKELKWLNPGIPIIVCSGYINLTNGELKDLDVTAILSKPFKLSDLEKALLKAQIISG